MRKVINDWRYKTRSDTQVAHLFEKRGKVYRSCCGKLTLPSLIDTLPIRFNRKCVWCIAYEQRLNPVDHATLSTESSC